MKTKVKIELIPLSTVGMCWKCGKSLHVGKGQIVYWHKACRKKGRDMLSDGKMAMKV